ncbi:MipA/OmpV family protein [Hansschlegelia sp. KR7-227]|jgi:outer membrane protein|uniref:MipA/OmpV family protein n=1 Tax=Hansschlegelia sp. KR7-227 TaxID=3400914 RepID=UPI003C0069AA
MRLLPAAAFVAAPLLVGAAPAFAADIAIETPVAVEAIQQDGWLVTLKATGTISPKFEGSGKYGVSGMPGLSVRRPNQPWKFGAPDDGFGFPVLDTAWFQAGPVARIRGERDSSDDHKFRGMRDIDWAIEPGLFVEFYPYEKIRVRGELRHGVWGHSGFVGNVSADWIERFDRLVISVGPRMEIGDGKFMDTYYGVNGPEALRNGRVSPYKADGGIKSVGFASAVTYDWTEHWSSTLFGGYDRLTGDAAKSPVAKTLGSKNALTVGLGVAYTFGVNW